MFARFTLDIRIGNEAMQTEGDVARALRVIANRIDVDGVAHRIVSEAAAPIKDTNGNTVGRWVFTKDEEETNE